MVVFVFMVVSVLGRFGVALLGFAYNLEDTPYVKEALYRPDWAGLTFMSDMLNSSGITLSGKNVLYLPHT